MKDTRIGPPPGKGKLSASAETKTIPHTYDLIVFCHLRWDFVFQRPQHIISRLAKEYKVLFVEEPIGSNGGRECSPIRIIHSNLHILQPRVNTIEQIAEVLDMLLSGRKAPIAWFYSAAFVPLLKDFRFGKIIYDCMDELTLFKGAASELVELENVLLKKAHVVFTGGKRLYEAKALKHHNVHCFPSSVERYHFEKAVNGIEVPEDIADLPKPVIGYYGVIDERIDLDLVSQAAALMPSYSFVMIGPLAKISADDLPVARNIYYLGMKPYSFLPHYLKGFDIAMMPFAMNDATRYISPTKTLEYMAAKKPVISTPIYDVVRDYAHCVEIISTPDNFQDKVERILHLKKESPDMWNEDFEAILDKTSWDVTVDQMNEKIKLAVI